jgi:hypothetical protein
MHLTADSANGPDFLLNKMCHICWCGCFHLPSMIQTKMVSVGFIVMQLISHHFLKQKYLAFENASCDFNATEKQLGLLV